MRNRRSEAPLPSSQYESTHYYWESTQRQKRVCIYIAVRYDELEVGNGEVHPIVGRAHQRLVLVVIREVVLALTLDVVLIGPAAVDEYVVVGNVLVFGGGLQLPDLEQNPAVSRIESRSMSS